MKLLRMKRYIYFTYLAFLVIYAALRAWKVTPLFDEAASFFVYFLEGNIWNDKAVLDANNHLFVSFWSHFWIKIGVYNFFFFRLLSIIGFVSYIIAWHLLIVRYLKVKWGYFIVACCVSIPWIIEYGALARGYLFAMACWFWMFILLIEIIKQFRLWKVITFYILAWFSIFTSLTFTVPVFLTIGVAGVYIIFAIKHLSRQNIISYVLSTIAFIIAYISLFKQSMALKEGGFLWWGSRDGLWQITGKSISRLVVFSDEFFVLVILIVILAFAAYLLFRSLKATKRSLWFNNPFHWIVAYTFTALIVLVLFDKILEVNYPKDRVGMYLVPLFLIVITYLFSGSSSLRWGNLALLFFPVTLLTHFNLTTTIFSPEDRITEKSYEKIQELIKDKQTSAEWMAFILFNYAGRIHNNTQIIAQSATGSPNGDYYLTTYNYIRGEMEGYDIIYLDTLTSFAVYKKHLIAPKKTFKVLNFKNLTFNDDNKLIVSTDSIDNWTENPFLYKITGEFDLPEATDNLKLHVNCVDSAGNITVLQHNNFHSSFFPKKKFAFYTFSDTFSPVKSQTINFYIENGNNKKIVIKTMEIRLLNE